MHTNFISSIITRDISLWCISLWYFICRLWHFIYICSICRIFNDRNFFYSYLSWMVSGELARYHLEGMMWVNLDARCVLKYGKWAQRFPLNDCSRNVLRRNSKRQMTLRQKMKFSDLKPRTQFCRRLERDTTTIPDSTSDFKIKNLPHKKTSHKVAFTVAKCDLRKR